MINYYPLHFNGKQLDVEQISLLNTLDKMWKEKRFEAQYGSKLRYVFVNFLKRHILYQGFYLYGSVGTGKSSILNLFFDYLDSSGQINANELLRIHFHEFIMRAHTAIASSLSIAPENPSLYS